MASRTEFGIPHIKASDWGSLNSKAALIIGGLVFPQKAGPASLFCCGAGCFAW